MELKTILKIFDFVISLVLLATFVGTIHTPGISAWIVVALAIAMVLQIVKMDNAFYPD